MKSGQLIQLHRIKQEVYRDVWDFQETLHKGLLEYKKEKQSTLNLPGHFIICEHKPVYTLGKSGSLQHLLLNEQELDQNSIEFHKINRGGDITYHGPGQLTGYIIIDFDQYYHDVHKYVRDIEEAVIQFLAIYSLEGIRVKGFTGVWIFDSKKDHYKKICAIGIHMSRWVSLHGFALNIDTDISYFNNIIPCGIVDPNKKVTNLSLELNRKMSISEVEGHLLKSFSDVFGFEFV